MFPDIAICLGVGALIWIIQILGHGLSHTSHILAFSFMVPFIIGILFSIWTGGRMRRAILLSAGSLLANYLILVARGIVFFPWQRSPEFLVIALKTLGFGLATVLPIALLGCLAGYWISRGRRTAGQ